MRREDARMVEVAASGMHDLTQSSGGEEDEVEVLGHQLGRAAVRIEVAKDAQRCPSWQCRREE